MSLSKLRSLGKLRWQRSAPVATSRLAPRYDRTMRKDRLDRFTAQEDDIEIVRRARSTAQPMGATIETAVRTISGGTSDAKGVSELATRPIVEDKDD